MGQHMARNLHDAGLLAGVWNRTPARSAGMPGHCYGSVAELAADCDAVVLCVSADTAVLELIGALIPALRPGPR